MNIRDKIGSIALSLGVSFEYARKSEMNINADNVVFPNILLIEPDSFYFDVNDFGIKSSTDLFVQFLTRMPNQEDPTKDEIGRGANYRHAMIEEMKVLAAKFIYAISDDDYFMPISSRIKAMPVIEAYDANVFGVEINIPSVNETYPIPC